MITCAECGSSNVWQDAKWYANEDRTEIYDMGYCDQCQGEAALEGTHAGPGWSGDPELASQIEAEVGAYERQRS